MTWLKFLEFFYISLQWTEIDGATNIIQFYKLPLFSFSLNQQAAVQNIFDALFSFSFLCKDPSIIAHCLTFRSFYKGKLCKNCLVFAWNPTTYQNRPATKEEFHYEYQCIVLNRTLVILFFFLKICSLASLSH